LTPQEVQTARELPGNTINENPTTIHTTTQFPFELQRFSPQ
jgi:hypothetical protein